MMLIDRRSTSMNSIHPAPGADRPRSASTNEKEGLRPLLAAGITLTQAGDVIRDSLDFTVGEFLRHAAHGVVGIVGALAGPESL